MSYHLFNGFAVGGLVRPEARPVSIAENCELIGWHAIAGDLKRFIERAIAEQGDQVEPDLVRLQHAMIELEDIRYGRTAQLVGVPGGNTP